MHLTALSCDLISTTFDFNKSSCCRGLSLVTGWNCFASRCSETDTGALLQLAYLKQQDSQPAIIAALSADFMIGITCWYVRPWLGTFQQDQMLCNMRRLCASQWVAVGGSYHGQLVWQRQEGPHHGPLECTHQCWQYAGMLCHCLCTGIYM